MTRFSLLVAVVAAFALAPIAVTGGAAASATTSPRSALTGFSCRRALDPPNRSISIKAVMRPLTGTRTLSLKFDLLERTPGTTGTHTVTGAGDLGVWVSPMNATLGRRPGDVWQLNKAVYDLDAPLATAFVCPSAGSGSTARCSAPRSATAPRARSRSCGRTCSSKACAVSAIANHPSKERYTAVIANRGATAAGPFEVLFTPGDGTSPQTATVAKLRAHAVRDVSFTGPVCDASSPPTVVADATTQVDDDNRDNNALTVTCPAAPAPAATHGRR